MKKWGLIGLSVGLIIATLWAGVGTAKAQQGGIEVQSTSVENKFPEGLLFKITASAPKEIKGITLLYGIAGSNVTQYGIFKFEPALQVSAEFLLRTKVGGENTGSFSPVGTIFSYRFRIEDKDGNRLETEPQPLLYMDNRFTWESVTKDLVTVYYYGPVKRRAETILDATSQTLGKMGDLLGANITRPIRLIVYNNYKDMIVALPFVSQTTASGLITQGQAHGKEGVLLLFGGDPNIRGVTSHEVTHLLVDQAAEGVASFIPAWLNEGLAEYGNIEPSTGYDQALDRGIHEERLFPIRSMTNRPGNPDDVILFYGQSRSIVRYLVDSYGAQKLQAFLSLLKQGKTVDNAMTQAYGFDRVGLDNLWRKSIGAPPLAAAEAASTPTPKAVPTFVPFGAEASPSTPSPTPLATLGQATPTPMPKAAPTGGGTTCVRSASAAGIFSGGLEITLIPLIGMAWLARSLARRRRR